MPSSKFITIIATLISLITLSAESSEADTCVISICLSEPENINQLSIAPYLFAPAIQGNAKVEGINAAFDYRAEELANGVNAGGMGYLLWQRGSDFFYIESLGFRYKDRISAFRDKLLSAELSLFEVGYGNNFCIHLKFSSADCNLILSPYIGLRQTQMDISITLNEGGIEGLLLPLAGLPNVYHAGEKWLDPTIGLMVQYQISKKLRLYTKTDIAGLGIGYNKYWNVMAALHLQTSQHWSIAAGYRIADFDASPGGGNKLQLEIQGEGPLFGIVYKL